MKLFSFFDTKLQFNPLFVHTMGNAMDHGREGVGWSPVLKSACYCYGTVAQRLANITMKLPAIGLDGSAAYFVRDMWKHETMSEDVVRTFDAKMYILVHKEDKF